MGDRYDIQFFLNTYNFVNQENGGISDDTYILRPEEVQGGQSSVNTQTIPTNLTDAYNRIRGKEYYATQRYKFGFYQEEEQDTTVIHSFPSPALYTPSSITKISIGLSINRRPKTLPTSQTPI